MLSHQPIKRIMFRTLTKSTALPALLLPLLLLVTYACYVAGLNSTFLFDDIPNLNTIGRYPHLGVWRDFVLYILDGSSGALGRPLSLASFYLNDQYWSEMNRAAFKFTNTMIHLFNGVLIFWFIHKLTPFLPLNSRGNMWLPLLITALWLLHPMHTNTVLYAVQRMTELSTLFTLTGLLAYLKGRETLPERPAIGWVWLLLGSGISLLLAVLSKENGILLFVYILVLEYSLLRPLGSPTPSTLRWGLLVAGWLPLAILGGMLYKWGWIDGNGRAFTTVERLMTESRILWDYLSHILIPRYNGNSLLHDDITFSTGLLTPLTTLPALLGILVLIGTGFMLRKHFPVLAFGILWFFAGHLLESTTIALELYFEHRNYLPMLGIVFALGYYGIQASTQSTALRRFFPVTLCLYVGFMAIATQNIAQRWTDPATLLIGWLEKHPQSQRTLEGLDSVIGTHIAPELRQAMLNELDKVASTQNTSSYLAFRDLKIACDNGTITPEHLTQATKQLGASGFIPSLPNAFADFIQQVLATECGNISTDHLTAFIATLQATPNLKQGEMPHTLHYWQAEVHAKAGNLADAMMHFDTAYQQKPDLDLLLLQTYYLISAGLNEDAENKLANVEHDFCQHWRSCLILKMRQPDIDHLRDALKQNQQQQVSHHDQTLHYPASQE